MPRTVKAAVVQEKRVRFMRPKASGLRKMDEVLPLRCQWSRVGQSRQWLEESATFELSRIVMSSSRAVKPDRILNRLDPRAASWARTVLEEEPNKVWLNGATYLLVQKPDSLLEFLLATHHKPYPLGRWVSSFLLSLAWRLSSHDPSAIPMEAAKLARAIELLTWRENDRPLRVSWSMGALLLRHLSDQQRASLHDAIVASSADLKHSTWLTFAIYFAKSGDITRAIAAYQSGLSAVGRKHYDHGQRGLAFIFRKAFSVSNGVQECLALWHTIRQNKGFVARQVANNLMASALSTGDDKTVVELYRTMFTDGVKPDEATLTMLVRATSRTSSTDLPAGELVNVIQASGLSSADDSLITGVLQSTVERGLKADSETTWRDAWTLFSEVYDTTRLTQLGMPPPDDSFWPRTSRQPPPHALGIMLDTYLRLLSNSDQNHLAIYEMWKQFQNATCEGVGPLAELATTEHCFNMFMVTFAKGESAIQYATEVMKEMQTAFSSPSDLVKASPSDRTWNILLVGLYLHKQQTLADQVLKHMLDRDIKPAQITWERVLRDQVSSQDLDGIVKTLQNAQTAGAVWTDAIDRALQQYAGQPQLRQAILDQVMLPRQDDAEPVAEDTDEQRVLAHAADADLEDEQPVQRRTTRTRLRTRRSATRKHVVGVATGRSVRQR